MGLKLNGEFQDTTRCGDLILKDNTGLWNADNEGGWDDGTGSSGGNPALNWLTEAWLELVFANGYTVTVNVLNTLLPFPNSTNGSITITAAMMGLTTNVPEGLISAKFWVVGADPTDPGSEPGILAIQYLKYFSLCSSECCVQKLQTKIKKGCDLCKSPEFKTWSDANDLLESLYDLVACKQYQMAAITLAEIQEICKGNNCYCGCG